MVPIELDHNCSLSCNKKVVHLDVMPLEYFWKYMIDMYQREKKKGKEEKKMRKRKREGKGKEEKEEEVRSNNGKCCL